MVDYAERQQQAATVSWEPLLYPLPFTLALLLRLLQLGAFAVRDELNWTFRACRFFLSLGTAGAGMAAEDPSGTISFLLASIGLALRRLTSTALAASHWQALQSLPALNTQSVEQLRLVAACWPAAMLPLAAAAALLTVPPAILATRLWGARAGMLTALLLAFSPMLVAGARVLTPEAITALLVLNALLALLWALQRPSARLGFALSGTLCGLALLNESRAGLLLPYGLALILGVHAAQRRPALAWLRSIALWLGAAALAALAAFPVSWTAPLAAVHSLLRHLLDGWQALSQGTGGAALPLAALYLTPLTLVGVLMAPLAALAVGSSRRLTLLALAAFALLALGLQGLNSTPVALLETVAAASLGVLAGLPQPRADTERARLAMNSALGAGLVVAVGIQAAALLPYQPYFFTYRNPWLVARAPAPTFAGRGEGMDLVAACLNSLPQAGKLLVATPDVSLLGPLLAGQTVPLTAISAAEADYVVLYNSDWLAVPPRNWPVHGEPEQVVRLRGVEYARIYANRRHQEALRLLQDSASPDDVIVVDAVTPLNRYYDGPAPLHLLPATSPAEVASGLDAITAGRWRLWHVSFAGADTRGVAREILDSQAVLLGRHELGEAEVSAYLLPLDAHFDPLRADQPLDLHYEEGVSLSAYGLARTRVQYRQKVALSLSWQAHSNPANNVAISLRLIDDQGRVWVQKDHWLVTEDGRPSNAWQKGERGIWKTSFDLPPGMPPGPYRLKAIVYHADTLAPLAPVGADGAPLPAEFSLSDVLVLPPEVPPQPEDLPIEHRLDEPLAPGVQLLGFALGANEAAPGHELPLKLWWRVTEPITMTYRAHLMLLDAEGHLRGDQVVELASDEHPTSQWSRGEVVEGRYSLPISADAASGTALLGVELISPRGPANGPVRLAEVKVTGSVHVFEIPRMQQTRKETLGEVVRLLGFDIEPATAARPGQTLRLTLYWQALAPMKTGYTVFTHVLDAPGNYVAGHDSVPANGAYPTTSWVLHEVITDLHPIALPADLAPGQYFLEVGLYDPASGVRLPAYDATGARLTFDRILLGSIRVE
ncbi:MAG: glycosyltransferase family 39 protein [Anaerolineae bacterium]